MKIAKELLSGGRATQKKRDLPRRPTRGYPGEGAGEVDWREAGKTAWEEEGGVTQEEVRSLSYWIKRNHLGWAVVLTNWAFLG